MFILGGSKACNFLKYFWVKYTISHIDTASDSPFFPNTAISPTYSNCLPFQGGSVWNGCIKHGHLWFLHLNARVYQNDLSLLHECNLTFWDQLIWVQSAFWKTIKYSFVYSQVICIVHINSHSASKNPAKQVLLLSLYCRLEKSKVSLSDME